MIKVTCYTMKEGTLKQNKKMGFLKDYLVKSGWLNAYGRSIANIQRILDLILINTLFYFFQPGSNWSAGHINIPTVLIVTIIVGILLPNAGIYRSYRHKTLNKMVQKINSTWLSIVCFVILTMFLNKSSAEYSRIAISLWGLSCWMWLIIAHIFTRSYLKKLRKLGLNSRSILYWGDCKDAIKFSKQLSTAPWLGYRSVSWFSPKNVEKMYDYPAGLPNCSGGINELRNWLRTNTVDCIVFSEVLGNEVNKNGESLISIFGDTCSRVLYSPNWSIDTMKFQTDTIGEQYCIEVWGARQTYDERIFKRIFDLLVAAIGIVAISPVLL